MIYEEDSTSMSFCALWWIVSLVINLKWDLCGVYRIKMRLFKRIFGWWSLSVQDLSAASTETETNREAFKRIKKGKPPCDENCPLGAVDEASRSDWWLSAGVISRLAPEASAKAEITIDELFSLKLFPTRLWRRLGRLKVQHFGRRAIPDMERALLWSLRTTPPSLARFQNSVHIGRKSAVLCREQSAAQRQQNQLADNWF